jgi:anti-anti-sigma factor
MQLQERHMSAAAIPKPGLPEPTPISRTIVGRRTVLTVAGEVDLDTAPQIADAIDDALEAGALELWIDLSPITFMDSSGVHLLVETNARLGQLNRRLAIVCPGGVVRRVLDLTGVAALLPLYLDRAAAHRAA